MLSGYLIWQSVERSHNYKSYLYKRFRRIYPELWLAVALEIIVMLALYEDHVPVGNLLLFIVAQSSFFQFWTPGSLRDYGCGTPNGALWTICVLVQFYVCVWFIYKLLHKKKGSIWLFGIIGALLLAFLMQGTETFMPEILYKLLTQTVFFYLWMFLLGALIAEYKEKLLPIFKKYWLLILLLLTVYRMCSIKIPTPNYDIINTTFAFCGWVGFAYSFPRLNIKTDISYGIYIYHMTVVNAMIELGCSGNAFSVILALVITCLLAAISLKMVNVLILNHNKI